MRFRKRIHIAKGLNLNFSKSGMSLTSGIKGMSFNFGSKGAFMNYGIPGTGIYNRQKISGNNNYKSNTLTNSSVAESVNSNKYYYVLERSGNIYISSSLVSQDNLFVYEFDFNDNNRSAVDFVNAYNNHITETISYHKLTPKIMSDKDFQTLIIEADDTIKNYPNYEVTESTKEDAFNQLAVEAQKIKSIFFWRNNVIRENYINDNLENKYNTLKQKWEKERIEFEDKKRNEIEHLQSKKEILINNVLKWDKEYVEQALEYLIKELKFPFSLSISFEVNQENIICCDIDLPEIDEFCFKELKNLKHKISVKEITKKKLNEYYSICVCSLSFFISGLFFNISPKIERIILSGHTKRISEITGNMGDCFLYSIDFERAIYETLNIENINPVEGLSNFNHRLRIAKDGTFSEIKPLTD